MRLVEITKNIYVNPEEVLCINEECISGESYEAVVYLKNGKYFTVDYLDVKTVAAKINKALGEGGE